MKYTYRIETDDVPLNPRDDFDNLSTFFGEKNSRYLVGGKHDREFTYDLEEVISELRKEKAIIVEFKSRAGTCYAVVERDQLHDEYIKYGQTMRQAIYHAKQCIKGEIETWLAYAEGEVYGYVVEDEEGNTVDSCWGFFGDEGRKDAEQEAKSFIEWKIKDDEETDKFVNTSFAI